jgi:predicted transcriptional regulator
MRRNNGIHLRLDPAAMARVDALTKGEPSSRSRILREGIDLRLTFETHAVLMRELIETAVAEALGVLTSEVTLLMRGIAEAARRNDETSRQTIADFIEALGAAAPAQAAKNTDRPKVPQRVDV